MRFDGGLGKGVNIGKRMVIHAAPYAGQPVSNKWHIIIPLSGRLTAFTLRSHEFRSKSAAEEWLTSDAGRALVSYVHENRMLPS